MVSILVGELGGGPGVGVVVAVYLSTYLPSISILQIFKLLLGYVCFCGVSVCVG